MDLLQEMISSTNSIPEEYLHVSQQEMEERVKQIKNDLGEALFIPGHHYQKDEVIQFADAVGDSLQLAQVAAQNNSASYIVFCGVHFMAETADMLTTDGQIVLLPDRRAGCSLADMADIYQTERAWEKLMQQFGESILPLTYVNSTAAIKAFVGQHGGATVTSSNAHQMVNWAFTKKERILFLPDQHLGRNTASDLGIAETEMAVWDPIQEELLFSGNVKDVKVILWKGHCSVHENFTLTNVEYIRKEHPGMHIIVHPECKKEVVDAANYNGSTKYIIETIKQAKAGSAWAIGTEMNLVQRIIHNHPDKHIISLNPYMCPCLTMNRIDLPHLLWSLESIKKGKPVNQITVDKQTACQARLALDRMLERG
ncbi:MULTISPECIES: quinolinate synthase NadA [Virgibacillus]|uniref:Quinolinate synthase n=1 Tax=Virgibacillus dokdonensis TaxID=302167 RepID=A0ABU7VCF1_9BACI|nr:quinolinate synthase NadA [Virgibacillus sp.]NWO12562.1 quinolinate synthase NadA [Virgibacillus sp.]